MTDRVYKQVLVTGTSTEGVEAAISNAIAKAAQTVRNIDWFEVTEVRGHVENDKVGHYQVTMKLGFRLDD
jgi:flavin-binding protein dodecin